MDHNKTVTLPSEQEILRRLAALPHSHEQIEQVHAVIALQLANRTVDTYELTNVVSGAFKQAGKDWFELLIGIQYLRVLITNNPDALHEAKERYRLQATAHWAATLPPEKATEFYQNVRRLDRCAKALKWLRRFGIGRNL